MLIAVFEPLSLKVDVHVSASNFFVRIGFYIENILFIYYYSYIILSMFLEFASFVS